MRGRTFAMIALAIVLAYAALLYRSAVNDSVTADETAHVGAGYSYWIKGDYRLNPEHPPFAKLLATIPLLFTKPPFPELPEQWSQGDEWSIGQMFLANGPQEIVMLCRIPMIVFTAAFALWLAFWMHRYVSSAAAFVALGFLILDPNIAAHGRLVTTDMPVTAFYLATCLYWWLWLRDGRTRDIWITGICLALALGSKFSAILLPPTMFLMWLLHRPHRKVKKAALLLPTPLILFTLYQGDIRSVSQDVVVMQRMVKANIEPTGWRQVPVPAYWWFRGAQLVYRHQYQGHQAYLLGEISQSGFVAYFPVAMLVKTATGTLLLLLAAAIYLARRRPWPLLLLAIPPVIYFAVALTQRIDIGLRHVLPVYPFLIVLFAMLFEQVRHSRAARIAIAAALLINAVEFARVYPRVLTFFNTPAGGPAAAPRYLLDSNIDWGQGLFDLKRTLAEIPHTCFAFEYFGSLAPGPYVGPSLQVPQNVEAARAQGCLIAVSVNRLFDPTRPWKYLRDREPIAVAGDSIYLWDAKRF